VVGYGEIGLNYYHFIPKGNATETVPPPDRTGQKAQPSDRDPFPRCKDDTLAVLKEENTGSVGGVMHASRAILTALAAIELVLYLVLGVLTFANAQGR
jgi:Tat protein secretion system quality control protein TatD with DNase activity